MFPDLRIKQTKYRYTVWTSFLFLRLTLGDIALDVLWVSRPVVLILSR
jgi:hypothetical protein